MARPLGPGASGAASRSASSGAVGAAAAPSVFAEPEDDGRTEILERLGDCVIRLQGLLGELRDLLRALHEQQAREAHRADTEAGATSPGAQPPGSEPGAPALGTPPGPREDPSAPPEEEPCGMRISYGGGASVLAGRPASAAAARAALVAADMAMAGYSREQIITRLIREGGPEAAAAAEQALE